MHAQRKVLGVAVALGVAAMSPWASAQEEPVTTRTMALGGGTYGAALSTSGIYANPAAMGLARLYHVDSSVLYQPSLSRWSLGSAVVDTTRRIGAGLSYNYGTIGGEDRSSHDARLALSVALTEGLALGVTGRYMNHSGTAAAGGQPGVAYDGFTVDAGLALRPVRFISLGVTGFSLTNPGTRLSPRALGTGFGLFPTESIGVVGDVYWNLQDADRPRMRWSGGVEVLLERAPLRLGYTFDETRSDQGIHILTAGVGYIDPSFALEAALRQEVSGGSDTTVLVNLRYFMRIN
jgi:hypothetical protein